jgi:uncharacterized membrane protein
MAVGLVSVALICTALAVDLGVQRVARRDMQALADVAALDLARHLKGRTVSQIEADPAFGEIKADAVSQNSSTVGQAPALTVALGTVNATTGEFTAVSGGSVPTAVKVTATTSVNFSFTSGSGGAARTAVASAADAGVCFSVSPSALTVNSSGSALGPVLDQILRVNMGVANPNGLLDVRGIQVPLAQVGVELGAATPQALLALENVRLGDFLVASANVMRQNGNTVGANALQTMAAKVPAVSFDMAKILAVTTADSSGFASKVDVFSLVTGAIFAANGTNAVNVRGLAVEVPGVLEAQIARLVISEPPIVACGKEGVVARGSQANIHLQAELDPLGLGLASVVLNLGLDLARGEGTLTSIRCNDPRQAVITAKTGLVTVNTPEIPGGNGRLNASILNLSALPGLSGILTALEFLIGRRAVDVEANIAASIAEGGPTPLTFNAPTGGGAIAVQSVSAQETGLQLALVPPLSVSVVGVNLGSFLSVLTGSVTTGVINPLLAHNGLVTQVLSGLLSDLGIKVASTDVTVHGNIDCQNVKLVG